MLRNKDNVIGVKLLTHAKRNHDAKVFPNLEKLVKNISKLVKKSLLFLFTGFNNGCLLLGYSNDIDIYITQATTK